MLLCQSISNMCSWKPAIYLSFASNLKEKLKTSTRLIQVHHRRNKPHVHPLPKQRKKFSELFKLTYDKVIKTSHGKCYTHSEKASKLFPKNTILNFHNKKTTRSVMCSLLAASSYVISSLFSHGLFDFSSL